MRGARETEGAERPTEGRPIEGRLGLGDERGAVTRPRLPLVDRDAELRLRYPEGARDEVRGVKPPELREDDLGAVTREAPLFDRFACGVPRGVAARERVRGVKVRGLREAPA